MDTSESVRSAVALRALLEQIDAGKITADATERAYIAGALDTLDHLFRVQSPAGQNPSVQ